MREQMGKRRPGGFTLMELLTVVGIIGMLMSVALLGMQGMGRKVRFEGAAKTVRDKVMLTRSRSIATGRKMAVRIQQTPLKKWKLTIIDSGDNIFDNDDDREFDRAYLFPKGVEFEGEQEIEFSAEGGITYATSNPIVMKEVSDKKEPWRLTLTIYKASGIVRIGELEKVVPEEGGEGGGKGERSEQQT